METICCHPPVWEWAFIAKLHQQSRRLNLQKEKASASRTQTLCFASELLLDGRNSACPPLETALQWNDWQGSLENCDRMWPGFFFQLTEIFKVKSSSSLGPSPIPVSGYGCDWNSYWPSFMLCHKLLSLLQCCQLVSDTRKQALKTLLFCHNSLLACCFPHSLKDCCVNDGFRMCQTLGQAMKSKTLLLFQAFYSSAKQKNKKNSNLDQREKNVAEEVSMTTIKTSWTQKKRLSAGNPRGFPKQQVKDRYP